MAELNSQNLLSRLKELRDAIKIATWRQNHPSGLTTVDITVSRDNWEKLSAAVLQADKIVDGAHSDG